MHVDEWIPAEADRRDAAGHPDQQPEHTQGRRVQDRVRVV